MKKSKFKLDGATIQKFLVLHCEKLVLVVVLGIMAWLVYMGYALPGLEADKTPVALAQKSDSTKKFIDDPTRWTNVVSQERFIPMDLAVLAGESQIATDPSFYQVPMPWKTENFTKQTPRTDPELLPPEHLIVHTVMGPLFSVFTDEELASEEAVDPTYPPEVTDDTKKKRRPPPPKRPRGGAEMTSGYPGDEGGDPYSGGRTARRGSRRSSSTDTSSSSYGPSASMDMADDYGMSSDYGSGMGGYGGAQGKINPESIQGFQGSAQGGIQRHVIANVITAVVPFEKQVEKFAEALQSSLDYEWQRDQPMYLGFMVERAEVPASDLAADPSTLDWKRINVRATKIEQLGDPTPPGRWGQWAGVLPEVSDPTYLDPYLTHPAPPFMQRNVWPLLTHPDVPLAPLTSTMYDGNMQPRAGTPADANQKPIEDVPGLPVPGGGFPGSGYPGGSPYGGSSDGGEGYGGGMPGMGMPGGMSGMSMPGGMGMSGSSSMYSGMPGGMGSSGMMSSGYGGSGYGYGDGLSTLAIAPPKYKLVRFTDTHVEQGKHYRYRLKVLLNDPNHPYYTQAPPPLASLAPEVQARIKAIDAEDAKKNAADPSTKNDPTRPPHRTYWREPEEWSQPSDVVSIPSPNSFFAGDVSQPGGAEIVPGKPRVANAPPQAKVLVSVWDPVKVVDVPAEESAYLGSTLNFVKDAKVIHPVYHDVVDYKEYKFQTSGILADVMGGEPIPKKNKGSTAPALEVPGEILVFDAEGNLRVRNETDDIEEYRRALVPEPDKTLPGGVPGGDPYSSGAEGSDSPSYGGGVSGPYPGSGSSPRGRSSRGSRGMSSGP